MRTPLPAFFALLLPGLAGSAPVSADTRYTLTYTDAASVELARPPFASEQRLSGFISVPDGTQYSGSFYGRNPPSPGDFPLAPVTEFRFTIAEFAWTPVGSFGILGRTERDGSISGLTMGFERDACGDFTPCYLDIAGDAGGQFRIKIYQPGTLDSEPVIGYQAAGIDLVRN